MGIPRRYWKSCCAASIGTYREKPLANAALACAHVDSVDPDLRDQPFSGAESCGIVVWPRSLSRQHGGS